MLPKNRELSLEKSRAMVERIKATGSYSKAFEDITFMSRRELRAVRLQLEYLRPEITLRENKIRSTVVVFGSARLLSEAKARQRLEICRKQLKAEPRDPSLKRALKRAKLRLEQSKYYEAARRFAAIASQSQDLDKHLEFVMITGGGPGIMEAANRGAYEVNAKSIGLNIILPEEQNPNPYITPELSFQFQYFSMRKFHFIMRAKALVAFPGGYGTLDELFEALTLVQTGKKSLLPVVLVGKKFWNRLIDFKFMADQEMISQDDLKLFKIVETADEAWAHIQDCWRRNRDSSPQ